MKALRSIAYVLVIIGGLNWGLMAVGSYFGGNWNVVYLILGSISWIENLVYLLVGVSAIVLIFKKKEGYASSVQGM